MKKIFAIFKILSKLKPSGPFGRKLLMALFVSGVAIGAFFFGRQGASQTRTSSGGDPLNASPAYFPGQGYSDGRVVAYLYGNIPITREEFGEYLIRRLGPLRIDNLINRRLLEIACQKKGIYVSDAEVQAQFDDDLRNLRKSGISPQQFEQHILKQFNKTLYEWREDNIRPKIAVNRLVSSMVTVNRDDLQKAFEAKYGPKVKVRMIVMKEVDRLNWTEIRNRVSQSEEAFLIQAKMQFIDSLREKAGEVMPIHKHFGDVSIERHAFALKPGEVSIPIELPDHTAVIMRCERHIPANTAVQFQQEEAALYREVFQFKLTQMIPEVMRKLREEAQPKEFIKSKNQMGEDVLLNRAQEMLRGSPPQPPPPQAGPPLVPPPLAYRQPVDTPAPTPIPPVPTPDKMNTKPIDIRPPPTEFVPAGQRPVPSGPPTTPTPPSSVFPTTPSLGGEANPPQQGTVPSYMNSLPTIPQSAPRQ